MARTHRPTARGTTAGALWGGSGRRVFRSQAGQRRHGIVAMSAFVPGAGDSGLDAEAATHALAQARQEAATLRGVLDAISDALAAATARLEALEAQITGETDLAGAGELS